MSSGFYKDYGINPFMDDLDGLYSGNKMDSTHVIMSGLAVISNPNNNLMDCSDGDYDDDYDEDDNVRPLKDHELDRIAAAHGWTKVSAHNSMAPMNSYLKGTSRLNFWLTTGTVGSYLEHPAQGKTQLFRRQVTMEEAEQLFANPRQHTGRGYQHTSHHPRAGVGSNRRPSCRYGAQCNRHNCPFDHHQQHQHGGGLGPCSYGNGCTRPNCWFSHPDGR